MDHPGKTNPPALAGVLLVGIKLMKQGEARLRQGLRNFLLREGFKDFWGSSGVCESIKSQRKLLCPMAMLRTPLWPGPGA